MTYKTLADLSVCVDRNVHRLPQDIDVVIGIPRSGLLLAAIIALKLNVALTDVESFAQGRLLAPGLTRRHAALVTDTMHCKRVLVVDDSTFSGRSLANAKAALESLHTHTEFIFLVAYAAESSRAEINLILERCPVPRIFEWNYMHHSVLASSCMDIDGVICVDPTPDENDDGPKYAEFLAAAAPRVIPTRRIGHLVTSRLEKYRHQTEVWLAKHHVSYGELHMLDLPTAQERALTRCHATFKAAVLSATRASLFIESSDAQAVEIAKLSHRPVLSVEKNRLIADNSALALATTASDKLSRVVRRGLRRLKRLASA